MPRRNRRTAGLLRPLRLDLLKDPFADLEAKLGPKPKPQPKRTATMVPDDRADEAIDFMAIMTAAVEAERRQGRGAA